MTTLVRELQYGKVHEVNGGAPCEWSKERGATHTLVTLEKLGHGVSSEDTKASRRSGGTRPAKLLKTVMYVGIDETEDGNIKWDKWDIRNIS